jgi:DNA-binding NarL/FixJ family response regulator
VAKNPAPNGAPVVSESDDRLFELFSSFSRLRKDNRVLVDQIRGSIGELRELRLKLRTQLPSAGATGRKRALDQGTLAQRFGLTRREVQVAIRLAQGRSNQAIAAELRISAHTARHHTQRILSKLGVHSRGEAGARIRG